MTSAHLDPMQDNTKRLAQALTTARSRAQSADGFLVIQACADGQITVRIDDRALRYGGAAVTQCAVIDPDSNLPIGTRLDHQEPIGRLRSRPGSSQGLRQPFRVVLHRVQMSRRHSNTPPHRIRPLRTLPSF